jgi:hypothetical protein
MMNIWATTATALGTLAGLAIAPNRMIVATSANLPDAFAVYQVISDPPAQHADDAEVLRRYRVQVNYFARAGLGTMPDIDGAMRGAGFTRIGGRELPYNQETRHYGYSMDFHFLDEE